MLSISASLIFGLWRGVPYETYVYLTEENVSHTHSWSFFHSAQYVGTIKVRVRPEARDGEVLAAITAIFKGVSNWGFSLMWDMQGGDEVSDG